MNFFVSSQCSSSISIEFTPNSPFISGSNLYRNVDSHFLPVVDLDPFLVTRILAFLMNRSPNCSRQNTYPSKFRCFPIKSTYFSPFIISRTCNLSRSMIDFSSCSAKIVTGEPESIIALHQFPFMKPST